MNEDLSKEEINYLLTGSYHNKSIIKDLNNMGFYDVDNILFNNKKYVSNDVGVSFSAYITMDDISKLIDNDFDNFITFFKNESNFTSESILKEKKIILEKIALLQNNVISNFKNFFDNPDDPTIENNIKLYKSFIICQNDYESVKNFSKEKIVVKYFDPQFIVTTQDQETEEIIINFMINFVYKISSILFMECTVQETIDNDVYTAKRKQELESNLFSNTIYKQRIINDIVNNQEE